MRGLSWFRDPQQRSPSRIARAWWRVLGFVKSIKRRHLIGFAVLFLWRVVDPFQIDAALTDQMARIVARAVGAFYPERACFWCEPYELGRRQVLVTLFDDDFVKGKTKRRPT